MTNAAEPTGRQVDTPPTAPATDHLDRRTAPWGDTIWFDDRDISLDPQFRESGVSWPHELDALAGIVPSGGLVLDVGANLGYLTCYLAHLVGPHGHVHAVEPESAMHALLHRNVTINEHRNATIAQAALGERQAVAQLWRSDTNFGRHSLLRDNVPTTTGPPQHVPQTTADLYWRDHLGGQPIDLLKLDIEGAEGIVLRGAGSLLDVTGNVWMEFWPNGIAASGIDPYTALDPLTSRGFTLTSWNLITGHHAPITDQTQLRDSIAQVARQTAVDGQGLSPLLYIHAKAPARTRQDQDRALPRR